VRKLDETQSVVAFFSGNNDTSASAPYITVAMNISITSAGVMTTTGKYMTHTISGNHGASAAGFRSVRIVGVI
jgi:hypothetical protein